MKNIFLLISLFMTYPGTLIFDFSTESNLNNWRVVDDSVMGGRSQGNFYINGAGHAVFEGQVSLENNGGFSSVRYRNGVKDMASFTNIRIHLKGDGKRYQFRVKTDSYDRHSYITYFETTGEWQSVEIKLKDLYPSFRGRKLNMANYPGESMSELAFLVANSVAEGFRLEIDKIELQ